VFTRTLKHALYISLKSGGRGTASLVLAAVLVGTPAVAQVAAPEPPGPYTIDLRGATGGLPTDAAFFPPLPSGTSIPTRGYGVDVGAHVYPLQLGPARLGVGVGVLRVRGAASPETPSSSSTTAPTTPDVDSALTVIAPQVSFNFGSSAGWSYLSAGLGGARVTSATSAFRGEGTVPDVTPGADASSGFRRSMSIGAGARWFAKARLGVSFDLRVYFVSAGSAEGTRPATPRSTLTSASVGVSVR
jgi:hypothetical protein